MAEYLEDDVVFRGCGRVRVHLSFSLLNAGLSQAEGKVRGLAGAKKKWRKHGSDSCDGLKK